MSIDKLSLVLLELVFYIDLREKLSYVLKNLYAILILQFFSIDCYRLSFSNNSENLLYTYSTLLTQVLAHLLKQVQ